MEPAKARGLNAGLVGWLGSTDKAVLLAIPAESHRGLGPGEPSRAWDQQLMPNVSRIFLL